MVGSLRNTSNNWKDLQSMPKQAKLATRLPDPPLRIPPGTYFCENILDLKIDRGQRFYLIKWKGYDDPWDNTWEPLCNLEEYMLEDLLDYEVEHAEQISKVEGNWREMYREGKVTERLQKLNVKEMRERLNRIMEQSQSEESIPIQASRSPRPHDKSRRHKKHHQHHKVKQIAKIKENPHNFISNKRELRSVGSAKIENTHQCKLKKKIERKSEVKMEEKEERKERKVQRECFKKRGGRRPYRSTTIPKFQQESYNIELQASLEEEQNQQLNDGRDIASLSQDSPHPQEVANKQQSQQHYFTPERANINMDETKKTKSQQRGMKDEENLSEEKVVEEPALKEDEEDKEDFVDQSQQERQKLNNEINSYFQDFGVENSVAEVLSRRIAPIPPPPSHSSPVKEVKRDSLSFLRKMSINKSNEIKYLGNNRGGCNFALHPSTKRFIMHLKRKSRTPERISHESQSESHHPIIKNMPNNTIIELDEEQKESSPVNSVQQHNQEGEKEKEVHNEEEVIQAQAVHSQHSSNHLQHKSYDSQHRQNGQQQDSHHSQHDSHHSQPENHHPQQGDHQSQHENHQQQNENPLSQHESHHDNNPIAHQPSAQEMMDHAHRRRMFMIKRLKQLRRAEIARQIEAGVDHHLSISSISQPQPLQDAVQRIFQNDVPDQIEPSNNEAKQLESINVILDRFQKKSNIDAGHNLQQLPPAAAVGKKEAEMISIDDDSSNENKRKAHPTEGHKFCVIPDKFKRIKKQPREGVRRGIVGRSEESLVQEGEGTLHYRPSLNTLFQSMLSAREVQLLQSPKVVQLTSSFRLENVIIFSAQVQTSPNNQPETRFISYQTLREHFPGELLTFLEDNGMIQL